MTAKPEIVKADKRLRNQVLVALMAVAFLGAVCIRALNRTLDDLARQAELEPETGVATVRALFGFLTALMAITLLAAGSYLAFFSAKVLQSSRFPPVGFRVIKDTRAVLGKPARTRGLVGGALAAILILAGSTFPVLAWRVMSALSASALQ